MSRIDNILQKREFLFNIRLRFSPETQPIKNTAIDTIVEQILFGSDREEGLSLQQIQNIFSSASKGSFINQQDMYDSINRLERSKRVISQRRDIIELYKLSPEAKDEISHIQRDNEKRFKRVIDRLFRNAPEAPLSYAEAFFKLLSLIFSNLGEEYVKVIKGDITGKDFLSYSNIYTMIKEVSRDFKLSNIDFFESAVNSFFREIDPEYDYIKWSLAQNYYIAKVLGLDPKGFLLSQEVFRHAIFYLDTNIIISALEPKDKCHQGFLVLNKACKQLGIELKVCQISINELNNWLIYQRGLIEQVVDQIPEKISPKINSIFYDIYCEKKKPGESFEINELFNNFINPRLSLKNLFKIELEDDPWFDTARTEWDTVKFARDLKSKYEIIRRSPKAFSTALHDAILLRWIQSERDETNNDSYWLVTLDSTLPGSVPEKFTNQPVSLAITLDALLQWISPLAVGEYDQDSFALMLSEMIKNRVLPQNKIFVLQDFLIFKEMNITCKELPVKDVEGCIQYIKKNIGIIDYNKSEDREKLHHEMLKFFVSPDREYKQEIARLEFEKEAIKQKHYEETAKSLKSSAKERLIITSFIFLIIEFIIGYLATLYGEGLNWFQKLKNSWPFLGLGFGISILIGCFIIGRKRLIALGWPFTRFFKA